MGPSGFDGFKSASRDLSVSNSRGRDVSTGCADCGQASHCIRHFQQRSHSTSRSKPPHKRKPRRAQARASDRLIFISVPFGFPVDSPMAMASRGTCTPTGARVVVWRLLLMFRCFLHRYDFLYCPWSWPLPLPALPRSSATFAAWCMTRSIIRSAARTPRCRPTIPLSR